MKDRWNKWPSVIIAVMILLLPFQRSPAQALRTPPEQVAREFYGWYLRANIATPDGKSLPTFRKYVTQRFIKKQMDPDTDADLFLGDISDIDDTWKVDSVSKPVIRGRRATLLVAFKGKAWDYKVRVTLVQENGAWKIDDVKNALASARARVRGGPADVKS